MKFCNNSNFTLPKQSQRSRSVLEDGSRSLGLFWTEKSLSYNRRNTVIEKIKQNLPNTNIGPKSIVTWSDRRFSSTYSCSYFKNLRVEFTKLPKITNVEIANSLDTDEGAQNELPHLDVHCLSSDF